MGYMGDNHWETMYGTNATNATNGSIGRLLFLLFLSGGGIATEKRMNFSLALEKNNGFGSFILTTLNMFFHHPPTRKRPLMITNPRTPESDQTLVLIKPDALKNSLTGYVLSQLSGFHTGLRLAGSKVVFVPRLLAEEHYVEHRAKLFFPSLIDYLRGVLHYPGEPRLQRVVAIVYQGPDAVKTVRGLVGPTNPHTARQKDPGSIRSLGSVMPLKDAEGNEIGQQIDNLIHASATNAEAEREIKLWFKPSDIPPYMRIYPTRRSLSRFYYKNGTLLTAYEEGSVCMLAEGDVAWASDLEALEAIQAGRATGETSLTAVVAKYLINEIEAGEEDSQD